MIDKPMWPKVGLLRLNPLLATWRKRWGLIQKPALKSYCPHTICTTCRKPPVNIGRYFHFEIQVNFKEKSLNL